VHVGTGNYNSKTARLYTDVGLLTCDPDIGADASDVFNLLTGFSHQREYRRFLVAPANLKEKMLALIAREADHARAGRPARIIAKLNAVVSPDVIDALYEASGAGVQIDLIVRGICCLRPGMPGRSENIRVISIIGRFLEHSRLIHFANGGDAEYYIGSADWMPRNLERRVEAVAPIVDRSLHPRLQSLLDLCLDDYRQAWELDADGTYTQRQPRSDDDIGTHRRLLRDPWGLDQQLSRYRTSELKIMPLNEYDRLTNHGQMRDDPVLERPQAGVAGRAAGRA
jgi:polyphosphate kinase